MQFRYVFASIIFIGTSSCAVTPQTSLSTLNTSDPKYASEECLQGRNIAMKYDNKTLVRGSLDIATFLAGPIATGAYSLTDAGHVKDRQAIIEEVKRRCITNYGTPDYNATKDSRRCEEKDGKVQCEAL